ncbi:hypothetical protein [Variovorax fucosicus]|uniref:hypothetical protein n=1 Tax=Variovorax fucosicus TaxID=3053517 RepID=UPI0040383579
MIVACKTSELSGALHADLGMLAQSGRALVRDVDATLRSPRTHRSTRELEQVIHDNLELNNAKVLRQSPGTDAENAAPGRRIHWRRQHGSKQLATYCRQAGRCRELEVRRQKRSTLPRMSSAVFDHTNGFGLLFFKVGKID